MAVLVMCARLVSQPGSVILREEMKLFYPLSQADNAVKDYHDRLFPRPWFGTAGKHMTWPDPVAM